MDWQTTIEEQLEINGKTFLSFSRDTKKLYQSFVGTESLNSTIANDNLAAVKYVRTNASLDATDKTNKVFLAFCSYVDDMLLFWCLQDRMYSGYETGTMHLMNAICQEDHLARYNDFLKEMGIDRHIVARRAVDGSLVPYYDFGAGRLLPYDQSTMSDGESSLMLFFHWLMEMKDKRSPSLVVTDEFDAFYHIGLSWKSMRKLMRQTNGQVILTTHNDSLISNEFLRPDSYFLMQDSQITAFDKTTDKEIREAHNLRRMFDAGVFDQQ